MRKIAVAALAGAALLLAACGGGDGSTSEATSASTGGATAEATGSITVWLQPDAETGWPENVAAATAEFNKANPNVTVNVEYQSWADHLTKIDAALAGDTPPDVIELGNTETTKYMAAGALADLSGFEFPNSDTWLQGLADASRYDGTLYGVPYYAGARAVIYRTDMYADAGIAVPTSQEEFNAGNQKLMDMFGADDKKFSAIYMPGKYWYMAMSYVYDQGGAIATQGGDGSWTGTLDSAESVAGLEAWKTSAEIGSRADKSGTEAEQWVAQSQGNIAATYGNGWEVGLIYAEDGGDPALADKIAAYPMPSVNAGQVMPTFLGGSVLAVPGNSANADLGAQWIAAFTSTQLQTALAEKGVLPNTTSLLDKVPASAQPFAQAAQNSWFVPTAPNWANVETAQVIPTMLVDILTGNKSVADAAAGASAQITQLLNQ